MTKPFTRTFRVRWSEINAIGQVGLAEYFRFVIETAWDWGAANGLSMDESEALGLAWVIRETEINFHRPLRPNDIFDLKIWLVKWRRVRGSRCFELRLKESSDLVAQGVQQVVTLDSKTMRPTPPPEHIIANFEVENPEVFTPGKFPKDHSQPGSAMVTQRDVAWGDLDPLTHVNNASYATFAENAATQALAAAGWSPSDFFNLGLAVENRRFHIQYQSPAIWGDRLNMVTYLVDLSQSGGSWYMDMQRASDGEAIIRCVIEWALVDRISGEEQVLPESLFNSLRKLAVAAA